MVVYVMTYTLKNNDLWRDHENSADKVAKLLKNFKGITDVQYYYAVVGDTRWKRYWLIEMESMGVRDTFYSNPELIDALRELLRHADPSSNVDMFWEKAPLPE